MAKKKPATKDGKDDGGGEAPKAAAPYVVLARKYRPATFADLIGQDAMVTTLRNAFATDRIAQGYMLTGVRGVGKTTTARILSRALNYASDTVDTPTFDMAAYGRHCAEIMEGRHPDVLEMDAASNTGVDNIREIIESARYKPMVARYKVYLIDEVHMLSKGAFNALLKTLEEPPGHVKFIFATTEVRKVPLTVLSRCQRFDLRRVDVPVLIAHFKKIIANEGGEAEDEALALIARAAEGSVRDGLSLLDQALAMSAGKVEGGRVRDMLGLADRGRIFDLLEKLLGGATAEALDMFGRLHRDGAEPGQILADLAEAVHVTTRAKTLGAAAAGEGLPAEERRRAVALAERLSVAILARAWQILLKGLEEIAARAQSGGRGGDGPDPPGVHGRSAGARRYHRCARRRHPARREQAAPAADKTEKRPAVGTPVDALEAAADEDIPPDDDVGPAEHHGSCLADPAHVRRRGRRGRGAARGQAQGAPGRAREPGAFRSRRQHRAAPVGRRAQGARQRAAREAQCLDRQALDGGREQDAGRAADRRGGARARRRRGPRPREAPGGGGGAAAVPRCRDHECAAAAGHREGRHRNWMRS